jgi:hypothetical protein
MGIQSNPNIEGIRTSVILMAHLIDYPADISGRLRIINDSVTKSISPFSKGNETEIYISFMIR